MTNELTATQQQPLTTTPTLADTILLGEHLAKSGYFGDARTPAQAVVKILAGRELGFPPIASVTGVHIIDGKPVIGAHLLAAAIKKSGRYAYRLIECTRVSCAIEFSGKNSHGKWEVLGNTSLTFTEAQEAGLTQGKDGLKRNWRVSPDDMLFARCISKGFRRYCPDLTGGCLVYVEGELEQEPKDITAEVTVAATEPPARALALVSQQEELLTLVNSTGTDLAKFLEHFGVVDLSQFLADDFKTARALLLKKLEKVSKTPTAAPEPTPVSESAQRQQLQQRIDALVEQLHLPAEAWRKGLQHWFQTDNALSLTLPQLQQLEEKLRTKLPAQPNTTAA